MEYLAFLIAGVILGVFIKMNHDGDFIAYAEIIFEAIIQVLNTYKDEDIDKNKFFRILIEHLEEHDKDTSEIIGKIGEVLLN